MHNRRDSAGLAMASSTNSNWKLTLLQWQPKSTARKSIHHLHAHELTQFDRMASRISRFEPPERRHLSRHTRLRVPPKHQDLRPGQRHGLYASCLAGSVSSLTRPIGFTRRCDSRPVALFGPDAKSGARLIKGRKIPAVQQSAAA